MRWKILLTCFALVFLMAYIGSIFSSSSTNSAWYQSIKPSITPPNYIFPIVWTILFVMIALSLYLVWINSKKKDKKRIAFIFAINLILNALWSLLFFGLRLPSIAFFELILLWFSILAMLLVVYKTSKLAFYLLIPYLLWVTFAGLLNYLAAFPKA